MGVSTALFETAVRHQTSRGTSQSLAIEVRGVDLIFASPAQSFQALRSVDLDVVEGTVHLIMGPAGAGKTSLLFVIAGLLTPTAGKVTVLGQPLQELSRQQLEHLRAQRIGLVFQDIGLIRTLTALENVELAFQIKGIRGPAAHQQAYQLLEAVGLSDKLDLLPRLLSVGQQQRIAVARALAGQPQLIIADEPTSALDSANGRLIAKQFQNLARAYGTTVLIATHDERLRRFADRVSYLEDGKITVGR